MITYFPKPLNKQVAAISDSLTRTQKGLGIGASGDTHAAIGSGQFVYVKDHSSLSEGLYKAKAAIAANGALSTSNMTADESGGLNDLQSQATNLQSQITSLNSKIDTLEGKVTDYKIKKMTKSGTTNASGALSTGMSVTERIIVGIGPTNTTNGHYSFDAYGGKWFITGFPANTSVSIVILYVDA